MRSLIKKADAERKILFNVICIIIMGISLIISIILVAYYYCHKSYNFDYEAIGLARYARNQINSNIFRTITSAGNFIPNLILTIIASLFFAYRKKFRYALFFAINVLLIWEANTALKDIFRRTRPVGTWLVSATGYSFPSGHAMIFMGFSLMVIYYIFIYLNRRMIKYLLSSMVLIFAVLVGISRVYLGVHYASDIMAGWSISLFWTSSSIMIYRVYFEE